MANGERLKSSVKRNDERGEARGEVVEAALLSPLAASRALARLQKGERGKSRGEGGEARGEGGEEASALAAGITGARDGLSSGKVTPRSRSRLPR